MGIHIQPVETVFSSGPLIQYTADSYSDITDNLETLSGSYVVDLTSNRIYVIQDNQNVVFTGFSVTSVTSSFPASVPSLSIMPAGEVLSVPLGYNLLVVHDLGLDLQGDIDLAGDMVEIPDL
jgi:hypothetical protein